jgi:amidase
VVEEAQPDYSFDSVWRAVLCIRGWQQGGPLLGFYNDPAKRALLKPEAIYEIEMGLKQSAYDITAASVVRSEWYQAVRRLFESYDYFIVPTAQVFPFDVDLHWSQEIAGQKMETYHEWMKAVLLVSMSGCPALAVPAGFSDQNLPIGIQISAPNHREFDCLQLGYAYSLASNWTNRACPPCWVRRDLWTLCRHTEASPEFNGSYTFLFDLRDTFLLAFGFQREPPRLTRIAVLGIVSCVTNLLRITFATR